MRRTIFFLFAIFLKLSSTDAQLRQPARHEIEISFTEEVYNIVSLKKDGLALIRDLEKYNEGKKKWELVILDTELQEKWRKEIELQNELRFTGYEYVNGRLNLMFRRNSSDILRAEMLWIDLATQEITQSMEEDELQARLAQDRPLLNGGSG
jgi:hypothetical protein